MTIEYSTKKMPLPEKMLYIVGLMQQVLDSHPRAQAQVRSAIHHWELAIAAEGADERTPSRD